MSILPSELQYIRALTLAKWQSHQPTTHHRSSLLQYDCEAKEMEAKKRAAALAALCMFLLLTRPKRSHQQLSQVECECYRKCYPGCKNSTPPWLCKVMCACSCPFFDDVFDPLRACLNACKTDSICDLPAPLTGMT